MPNIFISSRREDAPIVQPIIEELLRLKYTIIQPELEESNTRPLLFNTSEEIAKSEAVLVFIIGDASSAYFINSEIRLAEQMGKLIIPIYEKNAEFPMEALRSAGIELGHDINFFEVAKRIDNAIHLARVQGYSSKLPQDSLTPVLFAQQFYDYLSKLKAGTAVAGWHCQGSTDIAYGTPVGAWDTDGFLFTNEEYSFVLRSVANKTNSYLVVESVNLEGQLANLALNNPDKYQNINGEVSIRETYDMTVGYGRRSRDDVRAAFREVGMSDQVITRFNEREFNWAKILEDILIWAEYRELAKDILLREKTAQDLATRFWFLNINGPNWLKGGGIKEGDQGFFHASYENGQNRIDYDLFAKINPGDFGVAIDNSEEKDLLFLFEVTHGLAPEESDGREAIGFRITLIKRRYNFTADEHSKLQVYVNPYPSSPQRLFEYPEADYMGVVELMERAAGTLAESLNFNRFALSQVFADSAARDIEDSLGFRKDVDALAAVMVYKEVTPPLAIGLFGNWGSGKSFFMNKLQKRIEELGLDPSGTFCKKVLQISFNSWHYSDANLWASLTTKIFEELEKYGENSPTELSQLFGGLSSTQEMIAETEIEKASIEREITTLKEEKEIFEKEATAQADQLKSITALTVFKGLWQDSMVQEEFNRVKQQYSFLKLESYDDITNQLEEIDGVTDQLVESVKIARTVFSGKRLVLTAVAFTAILLLLYYLGQINEAVKVLFDQYKGILLTLCGLLTPVIAILQPAFKKVRSAYHYLKSLRDSVTKLQSQANEEFNEQRTEFNQKINEATTASEKLETQIAQLKVQQHKLEMDILDIKSGRKVINFIKSRVADERYAKSLGIISWVRKDFEQLDYLLAQQREAQSAGDSDVPAFELDRIILYIDDLDRCPASTVVKVLEAMNLLLAFPLFVVVVGVDPRWMHNALQTSYPHLKHAAKEQISLDDNAELTATSADYLEKIFQIPFALKAMNNASKSVLISDQLKTKTASAKNNNAFKNPLPSEVVQRNEEPVIISPINQENALKVDEPIQDYTENQSVVTEAEIERLLITEEEESFMKILAPIIGDSPRTIKRYINIYRIIRTHEGFLLKNENALAYYMAAMIMLALITGNSASGKDFFELIEQVDDDELFEKLIPMEPSLTGLPNLAEKVNTIKMSVFKVNLELICRFSFSTLRYKSVILD